MTTPDERTRALRVARKLLEAILAGRIDTVDEARRQARIVFQHYPSEQTLRRIGQGAPHPLDADPLCDRPEVLAEMTVQRKKTTASANAALDDALAFIEASEKRIAAMEARKTNEGQ